MTSHNSALNEKQKLALQTLKPILQVAGLPEPDMRKIVIIENSLIELSQYDGLTRTILEHDMPEIRTTVVLDHYTKSAGYKGIIRTQELQLVPVTYRLSQGELASFAWEHGLHGYVDAKGRSTPLLEKAAADLFYASFASAIPSSHLWKVFGDSGNGYRLRFKVTPGGAQLRAIRYHGSSTLLRQVNDALEQAKLPRFVLKGVSRVGAFYLPTSLKPEDETRILAKRFSGGGAPVVTTPQGEYWPVPLNTVNETATLELIEIGLCRLDPATVSAKLPDWCSNVTVVKD